jgi:hypothetical protein
MSKDIKVIYYVDTDDDTKSTICAIPSDKDLRSKEVIEFVAEQIKNVFEAIHHLMGEHSIGLAQSIAHYEYANMYEYEFGIEEIPLLEC